jgi:serine/threonine protein kinase
MGASSPVEATPTFGKYAIIEKLGEGYLGPVYRSFDQDLGRPVSLRILCDGIKWDAKLEEVFDRECRAIADLRHPNVATVFDIGREGQCHYVVTEFLGSGTLENLISHNPAVPVETKLSIVIQVANGLSHAHKKGILHRDLRPGKIHVTPEGGVKIRDFAIAHILKEYLPHPAVRWGVPIYLCPEQIRHQHCDERSDIFSAGTIFYELLTCFHPFHDRDSNKALDNILSDTGIPTFDRFPQPPPGIWKILRSCLARNPEDRFRSADELSDACSDLLKSLAEDTQFMMAELYASVLPLRKAATQPNVSGKTLLLLDEVQKLLLGDKEADYESLDQLMTILVEQYPEIQAAAVPLPVPGSMCSQLSPGDLDTAVEPQAASNAWQQASEKPVQPPQQVLETIPVLGSQEQPVDLGGKAASGASLPESKDKAALSQTDSGMPNSSAEPTIPQAADSMQPQPAQAFLASPVNQNGVRSESIHTRRPPSVPRYRRIPRPSYRSAAVLLSILVIATAGYIVMGTESVPYIRKAWNLYMPNSDRILHLLVRQPQTQSPGGVSSAVEEVDSQEKKQDPAETLLDEARALAAENRIEESKILIRRILETDPGYEPAIAALRGIESGPSIANGGAGTKARSLKESIPRISSLINSGRLQTAKTQIDLLQLTYPDSPELSELRKRWQASNSKQIQEQMHKEEEQQKALLKQKEERWNRRLDEFFALGKYDEAAGALILWLSEDPGSARAQELHARVQEIQLQLKAYASALMENRYSDAFNALDRAEKLNPADPNLADLRRRAEARKAAAKSILTVHRLGAKADLLLDGRPIGKDGEIENESIPIGSHTLAIRNSGGLIASRIQEYPEGQRILLVYDVVKQTLRTETEADWKLIAQRRAMEEVERFTLEHDHGLLRGSCHGVLSLDSLDVAYTPTSGSHGFRIPFKLLKLKADGRSVSLFYISDNTHFQTFKFQDSRAAEQFIQKWNELKALLR